jgi:TetR/AcrR family tetracycline transcriptional repressor
VGARKNVDRDEVLSEARRLIAEVGIGALSLRELAKRLDISSPALQWHVGSKDQLLLDLADDVLAGIPLLSDRSLQPEDWLRLAATAIRGHLLDHPALLPLVRDLASYCPSLVPVKLAVGRALTASGFEGVELEHAFNAYVGFVFGYTYAQHAQAVALTRADDQLLARVRDRRAALADDPLRQLLATERDPGPQAPADLEESFARGVGALLVGLGVPARSSSKRARR